MKEMVHRAVRTFVEAALGYIAANVLIYVSGHDTDPSALRSTVVTLITASVASGIAAVLNMPKKSKCPCESDEISEEDEAQTAFAENEPAEIAGGEGDSEEDNIE